VIQLSIPVSPEQEDVIADHLFGGKELGMLPDERAWMLNHARKKHPTCKIVKAELVIESAQWLLTLAT
jgi:hypothetical protein